MSLDYEIQLDARAAPASRTTSPALAAAQRSAHADRGKWAEGRVAKFLAQWAAESPSVREVSRVLDSRAANRVVRAGIADFEVFCLDHGGRGTYVAIECKSTNHLYRLPHRLHRHR